MEKKILIFIVFSLDAHTIYANDVPTVLRLVRCGSFT